MVGSPPQLPIKTTTKLAACRFQFLFIQLLVHNIQQQLVHVLGQQTAFNAPPQTVGQSLLALIRIQPDEIGEQIRVQYAKLMLQIDQLTLEEEDLVAVLVVQSFADLLWVAVFQIRERRITEYPKFGFLVNLFEQSIAGLCLEWKSVKILIRSTTIVGN